MRSDVRLGHFTYRHCAPSLNASVPYSVLPSGHTARAPEDALDTAGGLYLGEHTA